ncbi:MAG: multicopper oxidase domain-containing protein [Nitrospirota bacterium]
MNPPAGRRRAVIERGEIMNIKMKTLLVVLLTVPLLLAGMVDTQAEVFVQCPCDKDGDAVVDTPNKPECRNIRCMHLAAGDGFVTMADGRPAYIFGFADVTGTPPEMVMMEGMLAMTFPAPTIAVEEGTDFYLNLTNVGMMMRPDLFDPHTVHWHGFPQAAAIFDGVPDASISINMGATLTYYYKVVEPGTYMYHCHVEATEHMQMAMLGNLYVLPAQNNLPNGTDLNGFTHQNGYKYVYNDGDGSTYYDVDYPIQIGSFDSNFHEASWKVQPLPFALMRDNYPMLNGRGYPDTVNPGSLPPPQCQPPYVDPVVPCEAGELLNGGKYSQNVSTLIEATAGQKVLLRISNLNVTRFYTLASLGLPMKVVGLNARLLRGPDGKNLYYTTNSVTLGGGESVDVILDTTGVTPGKYFLYTTNMNYLSNYQEDFGGMMTEIVIN